MGRRQGPSEERRAAILAAAEAVFTDEGYTGASIHEIARRAGVSSALLYWFFPNKAQLFAAVLLARIDTQEALEFPPAVLDIPPEVFLPRLALGFTSMINQGTQVRLMRLILRESDREPELTSILSQAVTGRVLGPLRTYFAHQMDLGRVRRANPDYLTQIFLGALVVLMMRREIIQEPESRTWDVGDYAATAVQLLLQGILPEPGTAPAPVELPEPVAARRPPRQVQRIPLEE